MADKSVRSQSWATARLLLLFCLLAGRVHRSSSMRERVLIVDDEENIRRMMRITLEAAGYAVGEAHDGPEGLKLYGDGSNWDGVVLDQRMPGMDGLETLKHIKDIKPEARVVMATAYASIELAVDAMK